MVYITTIDPVDKKKKRITGSADVEGSVPMHVKVVNQVALNKDVSTVTLIDDVAFTATVTSEDINLSKLKHGIITAQTRAISSGSPTIQVKLQLKDSNGNYIDYLTLPTITTNNTSLFDEFYFLPFTTGRLIATFGGTGGFNNVTVELQGW
jgi:hypothetical protein